MSGRGYIGLTDPDWHAYLQQQPSVDEVNFWQPHGGRAFRFLRRGEPFFFKLRAPFKAIVGFGFFERFEVMPAWLAWDCFGTMNGAPSFEAMIGRIARLRNEDAAAVRGGDFEIGCILLSAPVFFDQVEWVSPPNDWARTGIQQGKGYELAQGEGARILNECDARARAEGRYWNVEANVGIAAEGRERYGSPLLVRPRLGQGLFSFAVRDAYQGACAVTHEHSTPVLEAAHIRPYASGGAHRINNGILLRRDLHRLYDLGYVSVTPDYRFRVGARLRKEFKNGKIYYDCNDATISVPKETDWQPDRELLEWHYQEVFLRREAS